MSPVVESGKGRAIVNGEIRITYQSRFRSDLVEIAQAADRQIFLSVYSRSGTDITADDFGPVTWNGHDVKSVRIFGRVRVVSPPG